MHQCGQLITHMPLMLLCYKIYYILFSLIYFCVIITKQNIIHKHLLLFALFLAIFKTITIAYFRINFVYKMKPYKNVIFCTLHKYQILSNWFKVIYSCIYTYTYVAKNTKEKYATNLRGSNAIMCEELEGVRK